MMTCLNNNHKIYGFDFLSEMIEFKTENLLNLSINIRDIIYEGETLSITKELAKQFLKIDEQLSYWESIDDVFYIDYKGGTSHCDYRDSIKSACDKKFCVIIKN